MEEFYEFVKNRRSIRKFLSKEVENEKIEKILKIMKEAPSAGNLQAYKVIIVKNEKIKKEICKACFHQKFIEEAPLVFVFFAKPKISSIYYGKRGTFYSILDATIAATYAMLAIHCLDLSTCWVSAFNDEELIKILKEDGIPIAVFPIGYPAEKPKHPGRKELKELVKEIS